MYEPQVTVIFQTVEEARGLDEQVPLNLQILAYAPTEFFHCRHCEVTWNEVGLGQRLHAEQRASGLLPRDLLEEYASLSDWVYEVAERYGDRISITIVDAASLEGVAKALRYRVRRFPAFILNGRRLDSFDRGRLDHVLEEMSARIQASI
jgi:hypothetical protein